MQVEQLTWTEKAGWRSERAPRLKTAQLVLVFADRALLDRPWVWDELRAHWPQAHLLACSTAGEIAGVEVRDGSLVATAVQLERSQLHCTSVDLRQVAGSHAAGVQLAAQLPSEGLRHVFVLSDGLAVNGSELVRGLVDNLPEGVAATGGLSGDGSRFEKTCVALDVPSSDPRVAAVGLYGDGLQIGFGSLGGWDPFGPERIVTRAQGAVLYELDDQPALELYKRYLGDHAADLPASGLLFPLTVRGEHDTGVVRTILAIDEKAQSLTFAGDVPVGSHARLMRANFDRLVDGASGAAKTCQQALGSTKTDLAILISCVGRKLVLQQRIEEEVEAVRDVLGGDAMLTGFYSYGEISPFTPGARCELHNQTMTITTLSER